MVASDAIRHMRVADMEEFAESQRKNRMRHATISEILALRSRLAVI